MKGKLIAFTLFSICFGCKKDNPAQRATGFLNLNRYYYTDFADTVKAERRNEYAKAGFLMDNYYKDAGAVKYGDSNLYNTSMILYYLSYKPDEPVPVFNHAFDGGQTWAVAGNAQNDIPAFSTPAPPFPSFLDTRFDTLPVIKKSQNFNISWDNTVPSDSISIGLYQSHTNVQSGTIAGNISSYTFTSAQLSIFSTSASTLSNVLIIEGRTYKYITVNGIKVTVENYAKRTCNVKFIN